MESGHQTYLNGNNISSEIEKSNNETPEKLHDVILFNAIEPADSICPMKSIDDNSSSASDFISAGDKVGQSGDVSVSHSTVTSNLKDENLSMEELNGDNCTTSESKDHNGIVNEDNFGCDNSFEKGVEFIQSIQHGEPLPETQYCNIVPKSIFFSSPSNVNNIDPTAMFIDNNGVKMMENKSVYENICMGGKDRPNEDELNEGFVNTISPNEDISDSIDLTDEEDHVANCSNASDTSTSDSDSLMHIQNECTKSINIVSLVGINDNDALHSHGDIEVKIECKSPFISMETNAIASDEYDYNNDLKSLLSNEFQPLKCENSAVEDDKEVVIKSENSIDICSYTTCISQNYRNVPILVDYSDSESEASESSTPCGIKGLHKDEDADIESDVDTDSETDVNDLNNEKR